VTPSRQILSGIDSERRFIAVARGIAMARADGLF
jgi:hypothetical protein